MISVFCSKYKSRGFGGKEEAGSTGMCTQPLFQPCLLQLLPIMFCALERPADKGALHLPDPEEKARQKGRGKLKAGN